MIEDGRPFALAIALKNVLVALEGKGILTHDERFALLDAALDEFYAIPALTPEAKADGGNMIGTLYHP